MKLSIIVPVYGVEKYILEFAESLLFQLNDEVELIIINDGTKDRSIDLLKEYVKESDFQQKNIIWLEQENQGQSVARNYGISEANGEYITFLDPDDYVVHKYISIILSNINESKQDLYQFNAYVQKNEKICNSLDLVSNNRYIESTQKNLKEIFHKKKWFSWLRVIKKEFVSNDFFPKGVNFQDMMAFPKLYQITKKIKNINERLVIYRVYPQSSVNNFMPTEKMIYSANYGFKMYEKSKVDLDIIVYKQFVELCIDYKQRKKGVIYSFFWLLKKVLFNKRSCLYGNIFYFFKLFLKYNLIYLYRILKGIR